MYVDYARCKEEPNVSMIFTSSFDGPIEVNYNTGEYKAMQNLNSTFYEEGLEDMSLEHTREGISKALENL